MGLQQIAQDIRALAVAEIEIDKIQQIGVRRENAGRVAEVSEKADVDDGDQFKIDGACRGASDIPRVRLVRCGGITRFHAPSPGHSTTGPVLAEDRRCKAQRRQRNAKTPHPGRGNASLLNELNVKETAM